MGHLKIVRILGPDEDVGGPIAGCGTKVIDIETGAEIRGICGIDVKIRPDDVVEATIHLYPANLELIAQAKIARMDVEQIDGQTVEVTTLRGEAGYRRWAVKKPKEADDGRTEITDEHDTNTVETETKRVQT